MADLFDPASALFQIGEDRYGYKYRLSKMRANGWPVYQCIRSADPNCAVKCLWLYKSSDGHWVATEAPKTSLDPINGGPAHIPHCQSGGRYPCAATAAVAAFQAPVFGVGRGNDLQHLPDGGAHRNDGYPP